MGSKVYSFACSDSYTQTRNTRWFECPSSSSSRHFFFFDREELPFTDSGKMPKKILTAMLTKRLEKYTE